MLIFGERLSPISVYSNSHRSQNSPYAIIILFLIFLLFLLLRDMLHQSFDKENTNDKATEKGMSEKERLKKKEWFLFRKY